jgi:hypothetical protein
MTRDSTTGCEGGTLCGQIAECCPAGNECIEDACLPECASEVRCGPTSPVLRRGPGLFGRRVRAAGRLRRLLRLRPRRVLRADPAEVPAAADPLTCELIPDFDTISAVPEWSWTEHEVISIPGGRRPRRRRRPRGRVNTTKYKVATSRSARSSCSTARPAPRSSASSTTRRQEVRLARPHHPRGRRRQRRRPARHRLRRPRGRGKSPIHAIDGKGVLLWTSHLANNAAPTTASRTAARPWPTSTTTRRPRSSSARRSSTTTACWCGTRAATAASSARPPGLLPAASRRSPTSTATATRRSSPASRRGRSCGRPATRRPSWSPSCGTTPPAPTAGRRSPTSTRTARPRSCSPPASIRVLDGATGKLWCGIDPTGVACDNNDAMRTQPLAIPGGGLGGPPTIADFDGDGRPSSASPAPRPTPSSTSTAPAR